MGAPGFTTRYVYLRKGVTLKDALKELQRVLPPSVRSQRYGECIRLDIPITILSKAERKLCWQTHYIGGVIHTVLDEEAFISGHAVNNLKEGRGRQKIHTGISKATAIVTVLGGLILCAGVIGSIVTMRRSIPPR